MINEDLIVDFTPMRREIAQLYRVNESECVEQLLDKAALSRDAISKIQEVARKLVIAVRKDRLSKGGLDAFMHEYDLSSEEGIALMCLAEALLRVPDNITVDRLIQDKLSSGDWQQHLGKSSSTFVNAATWALMLTGRVIDTKQAEDLKLSNIFSRLVQRSGEPFIRHAVSQAMRIIGKQFVMGRTIEEAIKRSKGHQKLGYSYSFDMLGEAACTQADADFYFNNYQHAIHIIGRLKEEDELYKAPSISVKLSALHPRYEFLKRKRIFDEMYPRLLELALLAKEYNIGFTIDAEEADRLDMSLDIIEKLCFEPSLNDWNGIGLAIQAYQKRGLAVVNWAIALAQKSGHRIMIRLVKGAYWDSEIKWSQVGGFDNYPVFTRKAATDVSYIACVKRMFEAGDVIYPQFATHNAYNVGLILTLAEGRPFEFQCLHGMGDALYSNVIGDENYNVPCRIYAPVGSHEHLLAYLVRRLLENGANSSFVNRIVDESAPIEDLIEDPCEAIRNVSPIPHPRIPLPKFIYGDERPNSTGEDVSDFIKFEPVLRNFEELCQKQWEAKPSLGKGESMEPVYDPSNSSRSLGQVSWATEKQIAQTLDTAEKAAPKWDLVPASQRAECLERLAELMEQEDIRGELYALCAREAGKTFDDAVAEVREAIDFCWYYAKCCREQFAPQMLSGPTGEINQLQLHGRGIVACISPWNFPLAIFTGQVSAALAAGNAVVAKPASQTPLIAAYAIDLFYKAGIPKDVLHLLPGGGRSVGNRLIEDVRIQGVMFTGSTETGRHINQTLATRPGPIVPFIAETGGLNAMIVDSSALPEQVTEDVLRSAFGSAGQRCSALRVLFLQEEIADSMIEMIAGAMAELQVGDPLKLSTDIGPVIDDKALQILVSHKKDMEERGKFVYQTPLEPGTEQRPFFAPCMFEIDHIDTLGKEVFGPILHVVRYQAKNIEKVVEDINRTGFGLTLGIHSRINQSNVEMICRKAKVGNIYVNRDMIGAVVGVQPFGGEGLSGTGPKAGGPHYLQRLATERTTCINTTAAGGNASLMAMES